MFFLEIGFYSIGLGLGFSIIGFGFSIIGLGFDFLFLSVEARKHPYNYIKKCGKYFKFAIIKIF